MAAKGALQKRLDEIYGGDPAAFTKARDALAKELKADDKSEEAAAVKKLKRPTQAAATVNRLSLGHPKDVARVLKAGAALRRAQENLAGANAGEKLKAASAKQRDAIDTAVRIASEELGASGTTLDRVAETLQGTASDETVAEAVKTGRLEREGQAAGLGGTLVPPPKPSRKAKAKTPAMTKDPAAQRKRRAAEDALARAEAKLSEAESSERAARERLAEAQDELRSAKSVHGGAAKALDRARSAVDRARKRLGESG